MSMDDQYHFMTRFRKELIDFNDHLGASVREVEKRHEDVSPLWQDNFRRSYDTEYDAFRENIGHYLKAESRSYVEFLSIKLHTLERFLYG